MKDGFIVRREEKHIDDKFWVCESKEDALRIAAEVADYWESKHDENAVKRTDITLYDDQIFRHEIEDCFCVTVTPQKIREPGETEK